MPVRRTHEPHQASRGGLAGSDASGRTLLTVRQESRGRRREIGELGRCEVNGIGKRLYLAQQRGERTVGRARVALVRRPVTLVVVMMACTGVIVLMIGMLLRHPVVERLVTGRVFVHAELALHACTADRAQHGRCHCAPSRDQDSQQDQQPDANRFHVKQVSTHCAQRVSRCGGHPKPCHSDKVKREQPLCARHGER